MPKLNRRTFIQATAATGLATLMPTMMAAANSNSATSSQMLWASMYNKAGSHKKFASVAQSLGVSGRASHGIHSKLVQNQVLAA